MKKKNAQIKPHYVDNKEFFKSMVGYLDEVKIADDAGEPRPRIPDYIGDCFMKIARHLSYKPNFINYTYRDDMISDGVENCCQYLYNFNPEKTENLFAYFTQIIWYAFLRRIQKEKRQLYIKYKQIELSSLEDEMDQGGSNRKSNVREENAARDEFIKNYEESMRISRDKQRINKIARHKKPVGSALFKEDNDV